MKNILTKLFSHVLHKYIDPVQCDQLDVALWDGKAKIQNLSIKESALAVHNLPFSVRYGIIKKTEIIVPWTSLSSEHSVIDIDGVYILATISQDILIKSKSQLKKDALEAIETAFTKNNNQEESSSFLSKSLSSIINNLKIHFQNIHIRLETPEEPFLSAGIILKELLLSNVDDNGMDVVVDPSVVKKTKKKLQVDSLTVYIDPFITRNLALENFIEFMEQNMTDIPHQNILDEFSFSSDIIIDNTYDDKQNESEYFRYILDFFADQIQMNITEEQYKGLINLLHKAKHIKEKLKYEHCSRPNEFPMSNDDPVNGQWFNYAFQCVEEKKHPNKVYIKDMFQMLKNRKRYASLWQMKHDKTKTNDQNLINEWNKSKECQELATLEDQLPLNTIIFLRSYSKAKRSNKKVLKFTQDDLNQFSNIKEIIAQRNSFKINYEIQKFILNLQRNESKFVSANMMLMKGYHSFIEEYSKSETSITLLDILYKEKEELFTQKVSDFENCCTFLIEKPNSEKKALIKATFEKPEVVLNFNMLFDIFSFFKVDESSFEKQIQASDQDQNQEINELKFSQIQKLVNNYFFLDLDLKFNKPEILIPAQTKLILTADDVILKTDKEKQSSVFDPKIRETLFANYVLSMNNLNANMNNSLFSNFSITTKCSFPVLPIDQTKLDLTFSQMNFSLSKQNYKDLFDYFTILRSFSSPANNQKETHHNPSKIQTNISFPSLNLNLLNEKDEIENTFEINNCVFKDDEFQINSFKVLDSGNNILISLLSSEEHNINYSLKNKIFTTGIIEKFILHQKTISFLFSMFALQIKQNNNENSKEENDKQTFVTLKQRMNELLENSKDNKRIKFFFQPLLTIPMIDTNNKEIGKINLKGLNVSIENSILNANIETLEINSFYPDFFDEKHQQFVNFNNIKFAYFNKLITFTCDKGSSNFEYDHFMNLIDFLLSMKRNNELYNKLPIKKPLTYSPFFYDIKCNNFDVHALYITNQIAKEENTDNQETTNEFDETLFEIENFTLQTDENNEKEVRINIEKILVKDFMEAAKLNLNMSLIYSKDFPQLKDTSIKEEDIQKVKDFVSDKSFYLHGITTNAHIDSIKFNQNNQNTLSFLNSAKFIFQMMQRKSLYVFLVSINFIMGDISIIINDILTSIQLQGLTYQFEKSIHKIELLSFNFDNTNQDIKYPIQIVSKNKKESQKPLLEFTKEANKFKLITNNMQLVLEMDLLLPLYFYFMKSPLRTFPYFDDNNKSILKPQFSFMFENTILIFPLDLQNDAQMLFLSLSLEINITPIQLSFIVFDLSTWITEYSNRKNEYPPLFSKFNFSINVDTKQNDMLKFVAYSNALNMNISAVDLALFTCISQKINSILEKYSFKNDATKELLLSANTILSSSLENNDPSASLSRSSSIYLTTSADSSASQSMNDLNKITISYVNVTIDQMQVVFCEDNRSFIPPLPLARLTILPTQFKFDVKENQSFSFDFSLSSIDFFNESTSDWDQLIEPMNFTFSGQEVSTRRDFTFDFKSPLNVNLSHKMIQKILNFRNQFDKYIKSKSAYSVYPEYSIENLTTGVINITLSSTDCIGLSLMQNDYLPTYDVKSDTIITCSIQNSKTFSFTPKDLSLPIFPLSGIVVFKLRKQNVDIITISSTLMFLNSTQKNLTIYASKDPKKDPFIKIFTVRPECYAPIPHTLYKTGSFILSSITENQFPSDLHPKVNKRTKFFSLKKMSETKTYSFAYENKETFVFLKREIDQKRGCIVLSITSPIKIVNGLPYESMFEDKASHSSFLVKKNESRLVDFLSEDKTIYMKVSMSNNEISKMMPILLADNKTSPLPVYSGEKFNYNIAASVKQDPKTSQYTISFFIPAVFYNMTSHNLFVGDSKTETMSKFIQEKDSENKAVFWGLPSFFDEEHTSLSAYLTAGREYTLSQTAIDAVISNIDDVIFIPTIKQKDLFLPLHYCVKSCGIEARTNIVTLYDHFTIHNKLNVPFSLQCVNNFTECKVISEPIIFPANSDNPLIRCSKEFSYLFVVDGSNPVQLSFAAGIHTTFRVTKGRSELMFVNLLVIDTKTGCDITISPATNHEPLMVKNMLDEPIAAFQVIESNPFIIMPGEIKPFAFDFPEKNNDVFLMIYGETKTVEMTELNAPNHLKFDNGKHAVIEVRTTKIGSKVILVSEKPQKLSLGSCFNLLFTVPKISISFIDNSLRELALFTLSNVELIYSLNSNVNHISLSIVSMQVDDMYPDVPLPVALFSKPKNDKFLQFTASFYDNAAFAQAFKLLSLRIQPITGYIDTNFASEMLNFFSSLKSLAITPKIEPTEKVSLTSKTISFETFELYPLPITFSIRPHTNRVRLHPYFSRYLSLIPGITNATINLEGTGFDGMDVTTSFLKNQIFQRYRKSAIDQFMKLIGHMDMFLNMADISSLFKNNIKRIKEGEFKDYKPAIVVGTLTGTESFVRNASTMIHSYIEGDANRHSGGLNRTAAETVGDGFVSFGKGIAVGFAGIVTKPLEGGKKEGFIGGLKGVGKGLAGALASPISGILDIGAGIIGGTRKAIADENETIPRERIPRAFLKEKVKTGAHIADKAQLKLQTIDLLRSTYNETLYYACKANDGLLGISQHFFWIFKHSGAVNSYFKIKKISKINTHENILEITTSGAAKKTYKLTCGSEQTAQEASRIVNSRKIMFY